MTGRWARLGNSRGTSASNSAGRTMWSTPDTPKMQASPIGAEPRRRSMPGCYGHRPSSTAGDTASRRGQTRGMQPLAVHHVSVNVSAIDPAIAFYTDVLGGRVRGDRPDFGFAGAWIDLGASQLHLIEAPTPPVLGQHFAIRVADLDAAVAELRHWGVSVNDPS